MVNNKQASLIFKDIFGSSQSKFEEVANFEANNRIEFKYETPFVLANASYDMNQNLVVLEILDKTDDEEHFFMNPYKTIFISKIVTNTIITPLFLMSRCQEFALLSYDTHRWFENMTLVNENAKEIHGLKNNATNS